MSKQIKLEAPTTYNIKLLKILAPEKFKEFNRITEGNEDIAYIYREVVKEIEGCKKRLRELKVKLELLKEIENMLVNEQVEELLKNFSIERSKKVSRKLGKEFRLF